MAIRPDWVTTPMLFAVRMEDERIVGMASTWHELNLFPRDTGGNIG